MVRNNIMCSVKSILIFFCQTAGSSSSTKHISLCKLTLRIIRRHRDSCYRSMVCLFVCVCLSVSLSRSCIVLKWQKISTIDFFVRQPTALPNRDKNWLTDKSPAMSDLPNYYGPCSDFSTE